MGHTKVFVGNLSFKTRQADLASEFSSVGKVVSANIITRGPRSLGYGFVELETEEEAQRAVSLMNKKSIDSREINVELARDDNRGQGDQKRRPFVRRRGRGGFRGGYYGGRGRRYRPRNDAQDSQGQEQSTQGGGPPPRRGRGGPRLNDPRTPSKNTLFVANLPFTMDDSRLLDIFKEYHSTSAHVVRDRNDRSKGFGFVEFETEEDQKAALNASENLPEVENRRLIARIALIDPRREGEKKEGGGGTEEGGRGETEDAPSETEKKEKKDQ